MNTIPATTGSYILWLQLKRKRRIKVGRLGEQLFHPGFYAYCGSAFGPGGLKARLGHHLRPSETPRWHIDYLKNVTNCTEIWYSTSEEKLEHQFSNLLAALTEASMPSPGFGSSDCNCRSHLIHVPALPDTAVLAKSLSIEGHGNSVTRIKK